MTRRKGASHRAVFFDSLALVLLTSLLVSGCGGGGGSNPTEPAAPSPDFSSLSLRWEYGIDEDEGPVTGTSYPIAGQTFVLLNKEYISTWQCSTDDEVWVECICFDPDDDGIYDCVWWPENLRYIAECRTTPSGEVQAYYHDPYSHENPGTLGPLVTSGCSTAEEWGHYAQCCLVDS